MNLAQDIINDYLPNIEGLGGVYRLSNKELFSLINDFDSFNFLELCKISFQKGLNAQDFTAYQIHVCFIYYFC